MERVEDSRFCSTEKFGRAETTQGQVDEKAAEVDANTNEPTGR